MYLCKIIGRNKQTLFEAVCHMGFNAAHGKDAGRLALAVCCYGVSNK